MEAQTSPSPPADDLSPPRRDGGPSLASVPFLGGHQRRESRLLRSPLAFVGLDVAMLATAAIVATIVPVTADAAPPAVWAVAFGAWVVSLLAANDAYAGHLRIRILDDLRRVFTATIGAAMGVITVQVLLTGDGAAAREIAVLTGYAFMFVSAARIGAASALARGLLEGQIRRPTLILGAGKIGNLTARRLLSRPDLGLLPVGFLDDDPLEVPGETPVLPVLGGPPDLDRIVAEHKVEHFIVGFSMASHQLMLALVRRCWELGVSVSLVPRLFEVEGDRAAIDRLGGLPLVSLSAPDSNGLGLAVKYAIDRVVAALVLVLLSPLLLGTALAVGISLGRPIFFGQHRIGRDGQHFKMWKFRTMRGSPSVAGEADAAWAEQVLTAPARQAPLRVGDSDRCTPLGRLLRRLSLDELPQLWNVLRGEMSLIGPRPERVHYVEKFEEVIYRYGDRHRVKSGITGWAQVNGLRGETSLEDRVEWDNYYIENWSLWLDLKIALKTISYVLSDAATRRRRARRSRGSGAAAPPSEEVG